MLCSSVKNILSIFKKRSLNLTQLNLDVGLTFYHRIAAEAQVNPEPNAAKIM